MKFLYHKSKRNRPLMGHSWRAGRCLGNGNESAGKSIHWPQNSAPKLIFMVADNITTSVNKPMSSLLI